MHTIDPLTLACVGILIVLALGWMWYSLLTILALEARNAETQKKLDTANNRLALIAIQHSLD